MSHQATTTHASTSGQCSGWVVVACLAAFFPAAASAEEPVTERFAVVIGHNASDNPKLAQLRYADDDAARMFELLAGTGLKKAWLLSSLDSDSQQTFAALSGVARAPSVRAVRDAARALTNAVVEARARGARTEAWFFYAGHGDVDDGEGFVTLADGRLTRTEFRRLFLGSGRADRLHVIVDACKSYFFVADRGPGGRRQAYRHSFAGPERMQGVGYVVSTTTDAESHEWAAVSGGVFSHEVRSALTGAADADADGAVDYDELAAFVAVANEAVPYPRYRPAVFVRPPSGDERSPLFRPADVRGASQLHVASADSGRLRLTDDRGLRFADVHKMGGTALAVALLPGRRYEVRWGEQLFGVTADGGAHRLEELAPVPPSAVAARGELHEAFEHLFEAPFGASVVRGFRLGRETAPAIQDSVDEADPWTSALFAGAGVSAAAGLGLSLLAFDAANRADTAPQADRDGLIETGNARARYGAAALTAAVALGGVALYRVLTR